MLPLCFIPRNLRLHIKYIEFENNWINLGKKCVYLRIIAPNRLKFVGMNANTQSIYQIFDSGVSTNFI